MKRRYMRPEVQVNKINSETLLCMSTTSTTANKDGLVLGKERGSRTSDDDFGDLW